MTKSHKPFSVVARSRKEIATGVERHFTKGPSFDALGLDKEQAKIATEAYNIWADSWLLDDLRYLLRRDLQP